MGVRTVSLTVLGDGYRLILVLEWRVDFWLRCLFWLFDGLAIIFLLHTQAMKAKP